MATYIEVYEPFTNGPQMVRVIKPFTAEDFEIDSVRVEGAQHANETFSKARFPRREVIAYRSVSFKAGAWADLLEDLRPLWKDGTDRFGKEPKRRWKNPATMSGMAMVPPGFDSTFVDLTLYGIKQGCQLTSRSPHADKRQLEIDAARERMRRAAEAPGAVQDWIEAYNEEWTKYCDWTASKLMEYVATMVKELRVKSEWIDENMTITQAAEHARISEEIDKIDAEIRALKEKRARLRTEIYDRDRELVERNLLNQQDPVLAALFAAAIESVKDERKNLSSVFDL